MDNLNIRDLTRNPSAFAGVFKTVKNTTLTTEPVSILFPERYINRELAAIGNTVKLVSIYAILDKAGNYCIVSAPIFQELTPYSIRDISVDGEVYKELLFKAGDVVIPNNTLVRSDNFLYDLFDEFFIKGNIPWYLAYEDLSNLLLEAKHYANSNIGKNPLTMEIITSLVARDKKDKKVYYRKTIQSKQSRMNNIPAYVGLNNIYYSFNNTGARLIGGYFGYGVTTAIVDPETQTSEVSKILRA